MLNPTDNVKLKDGSSVFVIKKKDGTIKWRKCKPVTYIFNPAMIRYGGCEDLMTGDTNNGYGVNQTIYLPCGSEYEIYATALSGYKITSVEVNGVEQSRTSVQVSLSDIRDLRTDDFDEITCEFYAMKKSYYTVIVPAKTTYIQSAKVSYTKDGVSQTLAIGSRTTIQIDPGTSVRYTNITPVSGYTASSGVTGTVTPTTDNVTLPTIKVKPKAPVLTWKIQDTTSSSYPKKYSVTATNPNPIIMTYSYTYSTSSRPIPSTPTAFEDDYMAVPANGSAELLSVSLSTVPATLYCKIYIVPGDGANSADFESGVIYEYSKSTASVIEVSEASYEVDAYGGRIVITGENNTNVTFKKVAFSFYAYNGAGVNPIGLGGYTISNRDIAPGYGFAFSTTSITESTFGYNISGSMATRLIVYIKPYYLQDGILTPGKTTTLKGTAVNVDDMGSSTETSTTATLFGDEDSTCEITIT